LRLEFGLQTKFRSTSELNIYTISALEEWNQTVAKQMSQMSVPQASVLALWSFGMVISHSCGLTSVSSSLAMLMGAKENSVRQRIREWYYAKDDKRGEGRCEIEVSSSFVPLVQWVLSWWPVNEKRLALAMDATSLGQVLVGNGNSLVWLILKEQLLSGWLLQLQTSGFCVLEEKLMQICLRVLLMRYLKTMLLVVVLKKLHACVCFLVFIAAS
jgi:hypothetical protein